MRSDVSGHRCVKLRTPRRPRQAAASNLQLLSLGRARAVDIATMPPMHLRLRERRFVFRTSGLG